MYRRTTCWCLNCVRGTYDRCVVQSRWITIDLQLNVPAVLAQLSPPEHLLDTSDALAEEDDI
jgi:hypothetical protein